MAPRQLEAFNSLFNLLKIRAPSIAFSTIGGFIGAVTVLLSGINQTYDFATRPNPSTSKTESYDFIIVGGGTSGSVLANRLAGGGHKKFKVLVIEAGGDPLVTNDIPYLTMFNNLRSESDWKYKIQPQANSSFSYNENAMHWSQGKSLGGSSNLGLMIYTRGNPNDYDQWATISQDDQWNYTNLLPYFKKSEDYHGNFLSTAYHGTDGHLKIHRNNYHPSVGQWIGAAEEFGIPSLDASGRQITSFSPIDFTMDKGHRHGMYKAFLEKSLKKNNLKVLRYAHAARIDLDADFKATGVIYKRHGTSFRVHAKKEIILCAGAIGSPQILMLSGIGNVDYLKTVGVLPTINLPGVGSNLQDHVSTLIGPFILNDKISMRADRNITVAKALEFANEGTGPFSFGMVSGLGFINTTNYTSNWPNIALFHSPLGIHKHLPEDLAHFFGIRKEVLKLYLKDFEKRDANFVIMSCSRPKSRGVVLLKNMDHTEKPYINPNYYAELADLTSMVEGFRFVVKLYEESQTWKYYGAKFGPKHFPGCEAFKLNSDVYYECYLRHFTTTMWNPSSTCSMGTVDNPMSVVDSNLRVKYVQGLRIADASIMPIIPNAPLMAATVMIAEKAADLILKQWA